MTWVWLLACFYVLGCGITLTHIAGLLLRGVGGAHDPFSISSGVSVKRLSSRPDLGDTMGRVLLLHGLCGAADAHFTGAAELRSHRVDAARVAH